MTALLQPQVQAVLERLHALADANDDEIGQRVHNSPASKSATAQEKGSPVEGCPAASFQRCGKVSLRPGSFHRRQERGGVWHIVRHFDDLLRRRPK